MQWVDVNTKEDPQNEPEVIEFDTLRETIDWYVERGFRVIMETEETAQLVRPKTFAVGWFVLFVPFYLIYHIFVKREEQVYLKPQDYGDGDQA